MNFAAVYLVGRLLYRIGDFFHHWYQDASRRLFHGYLSLLEELDRTFALRITVKYFFHPLYKDYTVVGRILGIVFRSARVAIGLVLYAIVTAVFAALYLLWIAVPPALILYGLGFF